MRGRIVNINAERGFGFIEYGKSDRLFFHITSFPSNVEIGDLNIGDTVEFELGKRNDGRTQAINCKKVGGLKEYFIENALVAPSRVEGYDEFCDNTKEYALALRKGRVNTSMIRNVYSRILAAEDVMDLKMLRPQFAYTAGRNEKNKTLIEFMEMLDEMVKNMDIENENEEVKNFKQFMEAIVAYRRYVGNDKN